MTATTNDLLGATREALDELERLKNTYYERADTDLYKAVLRFAEELLLRNPAREPPSATAPESLAVRPQR